MSPEQHALDFAVLRSFIKKVYSRQQTAPSVIGPDTTNCGENVFNATIAESPGIDVAIVHIYSVVPTANVEGFLHTAQTNAMCTNASAASIELNKSALRESLCGMARAGLRMSIRQPEDISISLVGRWRCCITWAVSQQLEWVSF